MFKIEKKIPIPDKGKGGRKFTQKYPFKEMELGDSFLIKSPTNPMRLNNRRSSLRHCLVKFLKSNPNHEIKIITRTVAEGLRVWRIK